jgi:hypothetical protein
MYFALGSAPLRRMPENPSDDHSRPTAPPTSTPGMIDPLAFSVTVKFSFSTPSVNNTEVHFNILDLLVSDRYIMYAAQDITWVTIYFPLRTSGLALISLDMRSSFGRMVYLGLCITRTAARPSLSTSKSIVRATFAAPSTLLQNDQINQRRSAMSLTLQEMLW